MKIYSHINIYSFLYPFLIAVIFGFLPGCLNIALECFKNKYFFYKKMGILTKLALFCIVYVVFINTLNFCTKEKINILYGIGVEVTGVERYFEETKYFSFMPKLEDLPKYKNVFYQYTKGESFIFGENTFTFVIEYDEDIYKKEKARLYEDYEFYDVGEKDQFLYERGIPENQFSVNSYNFKIAKSYKKEPINYLFSDLAMIGTSDEKKSIAYLYYTNYMHINLAEDREEDVMANFVKDTFKYDF